MVSISWRLSSRESLSSFHARDTAAWLSFGMPGVLRAFVMRWCRAAVLTRYSWRGALLRSDSASARRASTMSLVRDLTSFVSAAPCVSSWRRRVQCARAGVWCARSAKMAMGGLGAVSASFVAAV